MEQSAISRLSSLSPKLYNFRMSGAAYPDLCAVLLAGGRSCRMGFDKALIAVGGMSIAQRLVEIARRLAGEVLISANESQAFRFLNAPIVRDIYPDQGPLVGLH